ncbi:MAG: glutaredoxin 3 [Cypionkella sp.]
MNNPSPQVTIYTKPGCPYCADAKHLLTRKKVDYVEIDISRHPTERAAMIGRARGRSTVPQIFIGSTHVGGCDDLYDLDGQGRLDPLLAHVG